MRYNAGVGISIENYSSPTLKAITVSNNAGGGIECYNSSSLVQEVTIINNSGTGFSCQSDNTGALLKDVVISNNTSESGGGMNISGINPEFRNVLVKDNFAVYGGGALCRSTISCVFFSGNTAMYGGGIYVAGYSSFSSLINLIIDQNVAQYGGRFYGGGFFSPSSFMLKNVTCAGNLGTHGGGLCLKNGYLTALNTIVWNNYPQEVYLDNSSVLFNYSDVEGRETGIESINNSIITFHQGNIDADPLFVGFGNDPYALSANSPCIDTEVYVSNLHIPAWDIIGNNRRWDGNGDGIVKIDMGAYEFCSILVGTESPVAANTGLAFINFPNPFASITTIEYKLEKPANVVLTVYNNMGQTVATLVNKNQSPGKQQVQWNALSQPAGIYFIRLSTGNQFVTKKIIKQ